jgi:hypothetical protein
VSDINPEWEAEVQRECIDKMRDTSAVAAIWTGAIDWKIAIELGTALLMDKPIILVVPNGSSIPNNLAKVAHTIVEGDLQDPTTMRRLQTAMTAAFGE